jgi:dTDP-4-amino-4,6-dideoxygalactose transaminase
MNQGVENMAPTSTPKNRESASSLLLEKIPTFPFLDLRAQFSSIREELFVAISRVLESQQFVLGPEVAAFEKEMAETVGCRFAVSCASGSDALLLALMASGVGPGDEVVTTPFTFVATASSIARLGARPVFIDIHRSSYNLDPEKLERAITPRTRAILPVHLFGLMALMDPIIDMARRRNLPVIEDAAQAIGAQSHGRPSGGMGDQGCFSFFPSKNLGGAGDGGMVVTNHPGLADRLRVLRQHGSRQKYRYEVMGINSRLDSLQAAILRVKLKHLAGWAAARRRNAAHYGILFSEMGLEGRIELPRAPAGYHHVYNQFVIRTPRREELKQALRERGIPTEVYYPSPLHLQPAFAYLGHSPGDFPVAEQASQEVLALPIYPELTEAQQRLVVENIAAVLLNEPSRLRSDETNE